MPKVKLFRVYNTGGYEYDNQDGILQQLSTGWQEITQEELNFLTSPEMYKMFTGKNYYMNVVVYEDKTEDIPVMIDSVKEYIKSYKDKKEKEKLDKLKKQEEIKAKKEAKEIEKAKKLLEEKGLL